MAGIQFESRSGSAAKAQRYSHGCGREFPERLFAHAERCARGCLAARKLAAARRARPVDMHHGRSKAGGAPANLLSHMMKHQLTSPLAGSASSTGRDLIIMQQERRFLFGKDAVNLHSPRNKVCFFSFKQFYFLSSRLHLLTSDLQVGAKLLQLLLKVSRCL